MAGASTMQHSGIMSWVSTIRTTMANDPGRQFLEDQIQSNGFLFLEDYLDGILAGPKHDPIIELVKTPGRRKDVPKKTRAATAAANRAKAIITMSLEDEDDDDDEDFDKENLAPTKATPMNAFHKALLKSKDENANDNLHRSEIGHQEKPSDEVTKPSSKLKTVAIRTPEPEVRVEDADDSEEDEEMIVEKLVTPPHLRLQSFASQDSERLPAPSFHHEPTKELSIIAEDDEPADRSEAVLEPTFSDAKKTEDSTAMENIVPVAQSTPPPSSSSKQAHSMDVDAHLQPAKEDNVPMQTLPTERPASNQSQQADIASHSAKSDLRYEDTTDFRFLSHTASAHTDDENEDDTLERKLRLKTTMPHFPSIGAPSPVRMSMRAPREPSLASGFGATKPSLTRSSWLVKAKEAKAIEENAKRMSGLPAAGKIALPSTATASKRKSGEMLGFTPTGETTQESSERKQKVTKITEETTAAIAVKDSESRSTPDQNQVLSHSDTDMLVDELVDVEASVHNPEGMIDKLRKTVAGFSARSGKSMGKSLGGAAATALAEARAAAEAKIAERHAAEGRAVPVASATSAPSAAEMKEPTSVFSRPPSGTIASTSSLPKAGEHERRLSVSDLVTKYEVKKKIEVQEPVFRPPPPAVQKEPTSRLSNALADISTSTTPPDSPPRARQPVFSIDKPTLAPAQPVFTAPPQPTAQSSSHLNTLNAFESRVMNSLQPQPLSNHSTLVSTQSSIFSDGIFDHTPSMWGPSTQDTELFEDPVTSQHDQYKYFGTQPTNQDSDVEANESWHLDDKYTATWTPNINMHVREEEMTWNSTSSRSTNDTGSQRLNISVPPPGGKSQGGASANKLETSEPHRTEEDGADEEDMDIEEDDEDLGAIRLVPSASQSTTSLVSQNKTHSRSESQQSYQSSTNGASQLGFFSSATKFVSSVLGGSKKKAEPVKSIQLAAAAAKKQQEEAEKKAARLKEMDARRQQALQKKAEEDKAREEKRIREEDERWKREREKEDTTEKRTLKQPGKKLTQMEDDMTKKKEVTKVDKVESKKPPSKDKKDMVIPKVAGKPATASQPSTGASLAASKSSKLNAWANSSTTSTFKMVDMIVDAKSTLATSTNPSKAKGKGKATDDLDDHHPAKVMQAQMQARVQAQIKEAKKDSPRIASENIELPDIHSEYSDSDDEDRKKDLPQWVQSPELQAALRQQSTVDPDDIFGAIKPLKMEELFKNRTSRFRARTSSANWAGTDEVTAAEEREYARRMGYTK